MEQAKRVAKNTGFLYARMAITVLISLYATRLILAALGTEDFGTFNLVAGIIAMLTFLNAAMSSSTQRFMSHAQGQGDKDKQKNIFNVSIVLHLFIGLVIVILMEIAGFFFFNDFLNISQNRIYAAKVIFHFMVASTFFTIISVPYDAVINARENMLFVAILGVFEVLLKLSIAIYLSYTIFDRLIVYGFLMALLSIILLIIRKIYCQKTYDEAEINIKQCFNKALFKEMTEFAGWSLFGNMVSMVTFYGQGIVLNMFFGTRVNASQGIASQVSGQLGAFSSMMLKALNPVIVKSEGAGRQDMLMKSTFIGSKLSFFLLAFFAIPFIQEMPFILNVWLVEVPEFAITFCRLLLILNLIEQMFITLPVAIAATGKIKSYVISSSLFNSLTLIITFFLFKNNFAPPTIYVVSIFIALFRSFFIILYFAKKRINLSVQNFLIEVTLRCLLMSLVMSVFSSLPRLVFNEGFMRFICVGFLSSLAFLILIKKIGLTKDEGSQMNLLIIDVKKKLFSFRKVK